MVLVGRLGSGIGPGGTGGRPRAAAGLLGTTAAAGLLLYLGSGTGAGTTAAAGLLLYLGSGTGAGTTAAAGLLLYRGSATGAGTTAVSVGGAYGSA